MKKSIDFSRTPAMEIGKDNHCVVKTVQPENIFNLPEGILGFENSRKYVFLLNDKVRPFMFMQSLDRELCFVCVETFLIKPDFGIKLPESNVEFLELERPDDALILSLVTVRKQVDDITANLMSPIVVNLKNSKAQQVIIEDSSYQVKYKIWDAIEKYSPIFSAG